MMCFMVYFQSVFLFCITVIQVTNCATSTTFIAGELAENETDYVGLQAFKSKISGDPQGVLNSWNDSHHFCEWEGIRCGHRHRRVTILDLESRGLFGSLSPYIGNLSFLREIHLANNSIQGEIPDEVGGLFRLNVLSLFNNSLAGKIPANLSRCSRLTILSVGLNKLVGKIPVELVSLSNLQVLSIHQNILTGGIPPFIGNLTSLEVISAVENAFEGNIPDSLGRLKKLTFLALADNYLSGKVPLSMYNLSLLDTFYVSFNQLHGSLPPNLGLSLPRLQDFGVSGNFFGGSVPVSLSNASKLETIEMNENNFSGKLSVNFGGMQYLTDLLIFSNSLGGEGDEMSFINSLVNCSNLLVLEFGENQFRGALPHSIANLSTKMQVLHFQRNRLNGSIPSGISNLVNLEILALGHNQFTGSIPKEMGQLQKLQRMNFYGNQLSGEIPFSLGNLSLLYRLDLCCNKLSGIIPSSLGNLKSLAVLDLFANDLTGTIPKEIFDITYLSVSLDLGQNHLVGSLPSNIGNLKHLSMFDMSDNSISGEIPTELGYCSNLEYLHLGGNFFYGSIPSSLSSLRGIRDIDLSRNNLSGQIPKFLQTLSLENLNLSFNNLEGEVPMKGIFANASAISLVGNSNRLCGGIADLKLPKCNKNDSKNEKNPPLFKILISTIASVSGLVMVSFFIFCLLRKRRGKELPSTTGSMLKKALVKVSYEMLRNATDGFSPTRLIGMGSFGSVYKGFLDQEGTVVAVKVLNLQRQGASKSFMAECKALRNIRHRNLVRVITSCSSVDFQGNDFKALVYEYMPNGSLERWLHPTSEAEEEQPEIQSLTFLQRINIAIDVASALDYLHNHCQKPVFHCDLKPSNVLLASDMTAHVGDFGLARFLPEVSNPIQSSSSSIGVRGTIGYVAPEYGLGSDVSTNGDVYSYGIMLLEMITRKRPIDIMFEGDLNLHNYARMALPDRVMDIVDPVLPNYDEEVAATDHKLIQERNNTRKECIISIVKIGIACSMESPQDRMNIIDVARELKLVKNTLCRPRIVPHQRGC